MDNFIGDSGRPPPNGAARGIGRSVRMSWQPQVRDRKKTLTLVLLIHIALGAGLLHGLAGEPLRRTAETVATFDVRLPEPPPLVIPPTENASPDKRKAGATDLSARPAPVVPVPRVRLPVPLRIAASKEAAPDSASAANAGAGLVSGTGTGSGSDGNGFGGGGSGSGSGGIFASEARLVSGNLSRGDYRRIRGFGAPRGQAVLGIEVGAEGRLTRCLPIASSGNPALDAELCRLLARTRWEPARDRNSMPVRVALRYVATWDRD